MYGPTNEWSYQDDRIGTASLEWDYTETLELAYAHWEQIRAIGLIKPVGGKQVKDEDDVWVDEWSYRDDQMGPASFAWDYKIYRIGPRSLRAG